MEAWVGVDGLYAQGAEGCGQCDGLTFEGLVHVLRLEALRRDVLHRDRLGGRSAAVDEEQADCRASADEVLGLSVPWGG